MKCPHCGEELPEGFAYTPPTTPETADNDTDTTINKSIDSTIDDAVSSTDTAADADTTADTAAVQDADTTADTAADTSAAVQTVPDIPLIEYVQPQRKSKKPLIISVCAAAVIAAVAIGIGEAVSHHAAAQLKEDMVGTWQNYDSLMTTGTLKVTEDSMTYNESFGFMETNSFSYTYKAVASDKIKIDGNTYKVSLDKNNGTMTITPGLTGGSTEVWYAPAAIRPDGSGMDDDTENNGVL